MIDLTKRPTADTPEGTLVGYDCGGWRYGYFECLNKAGTEVRVRPIPPYRGAQPHSRWVPIGLVETE